MNVEIWTVAMQFPVKEYVNWDFRCSVYRLPLPPSASWLLTSHSDIFGDFLRGLTFALAATFLYGESNAWRSSFTILTFF